MAKKPNLVDTQYVYNEYTETGRNWTEIQRIQEEMALAINEYKKKLQELSDRNKAIRRVCKHEFHVSYAQSWVICYQCIHCHKTHYEYK